MNFSIPQLIQVPIQIVLALTVVIIAIVIVGLASPSQKLSRLKLLFGFVIGILIGILIHKIPISSQSIFVIQATVTGATGGFLYSMQNRKLELPTEDKLNPNIYNPGFLVDCFTGVAGAYIVFLLIPGDYGNKNDITYLIKILALGLIGGYAGRNLLEVAVDRFLRGEVDAIKIQANQNQIQIQANNEVKALLDIHFDRFEGLNFEELEKLNKSLKAALPEVRTQARLQAQNVSEDADQKLEQAKKDNNEVIINKSKDSIRRVIQVLEILIAIERDNPIPNTYGQLGYALKIISKWDEAERQFTNAIQIIQNKGSQQLGNTDKVIQKWCEYQRAICRMELKKIKDAEIDFRSANQDQKLAELIKNDSKIQDWLKINNITL